MKRSAFTFVELIFVIVVLGILAAVAIPRLGKNMEHAQIAKAKGDVSAIRAAIASARQKMLVTGTNAYPDSLDDGLSSGKIFDTNGSITILTYPIYEKNNPGHWRKTAANTYTYKVVTTDIDFTYGGINSGSFDCDHSEEYCKDITE